MTYGRLSRLKLKVVELPFDEVELVIFGDTHIGSKKCNFKILKERIEYVRNTPNAYAIMLGDIINNSTRHSVGDCYEEPLSPMNQMKLAVRLFEPIADKILAGCSGNHERRTYRQDGIDLSYFLASELGYADNYDSVAVLLGISLPNKTKQFVYLTHGDGAGGRTIGGKANALERRGQIIDADVIVTGHTHQPMTFVESTFVIDRIHENIRTVRQTFVNIDSTLEYEEYAELYGLKPSAVCDPHIFIGGTQKNPKCRVTL